MTLLTFFAPQEAEELGLPARRRKRTTVIVRRRREHVVIDDEEERKRGLAAFTALHDVDHDTHQLSDADLARAIREDEEWLLLL